MKLISLNVAIKMANTQQVVDFLQHEHADFVALQEVTRHLDASVHRTYQTKADIEQALGETYPYTFFGPTWVGNGFKTPQKVDYDFGGHIEQGCELLSRFPIAGGTNEFFYKHFEYMQDWSNWRQEDHGRALLVTTVDIDGKPLQILNLHGIWTSDKQGDARTEAQSRYIIEAAKRRDLPTIIVGDFNLLPETASIRILSAHFRNLLKEFNIQTTTPDFKDEIDVGGRAIDYVFVDERIKVLGFTVPQLAILDHLPLVLEFELG